MLRDIYFYNIQIKFNNFNLFYPVLELTNYNVIINNKIQFKMDKKIGFWRKLQNINLEDLPYPIISNKKYSNIFINKCKDWIELNERIFDYPGEVSFCVAYRWFSECRICRKPNGHLEYTYKNFIFPSGIFHYIVDHNIEIDDDFRVMIEENDLPHYLIDRSNNRSILSHR